MAVRLTDLAKKVNLTLPELREKIIAAGFALSPTEHAVSEDVAKTIEKKFAEATGKGRAEAVADEIERDLDREIIKQQRKQTAGKPGGATLRVRGKKKESEKKPSFEEPGGPTEIPDVISVKEFAEKTGISAAKIIGQLMKNGILANINQIIDFDTASVIANDLGIEIKHKRSEATVADLFERNLEKLLGEDDPKDLASRPPVVCVMGHVDHGKTKLLDSIRKTDVLSTESGGITQHIGAYQVAVQSEKPELNGRKITFLDTPGHEAFTAMRARGAKATDIAILVVAADEGVKPQTIEAINHAKEANIPIIVALNKIDKKEANLDRVKSELGEYGLTPEEWGGQTIMAPISAKTGQNVPQLLEMVLLVADMANFKANQKRPAVGTVIETHLDPSLGPVATIIVNTGTLHITDSVVVGGTYGRIKVMQDYRGKKIKEALPSDPVKIAGLSAQPHVGDILQVAKDVSTAKKQSLQISQLEKLGVREHRGLGVEELVLQIHAGKLRTLKVVLKTDTTGSLEAIRQALIKLKNEEVAIKLIHGGVGNVTESDVMMAAASQGILVGFHVDALPQVKRLAEREHVDIFHYQVIYKLIEDLKKLLSGLMEPEIVLVPLGSFEVLKIFFSKKGEMIVGGRVTKGKLEQRIKAHVIRGKEKIGEGEIASLKRGKDSVAEVAEGYECGIKYAGSTTLQEGDVLDVFKQEKRLRTLDSPPASSQAST